MMKEKKSPVIIEGAMISELDTVIRAMGSVTERTLCGYPVFEGSIDGCPVVVVRNKVGMINAAIATKAAIDAYMPRCLISEGTAGGYDASLHTGDIILGEQIYNINSVFMRIEDGFKLNTITSGEWRRDQCFKGDAELLEIASGIDMPGLSMKKAAMGSADFWSFRAEDIRRIQERFGTVCEDMESFSVAQTCAQAGIPCLCIRVISNNEPAGEAFNENAALYAQQFTLELLKRINA